MPLNGPGQTRERIAGCPQFQIAQPTDHAAVRLEQRYVVSKLGGLGDVSIKCRGQLIAQIQEAEREG
jgi:hypothetical protein